MPNPVSRFLKFVIGSRLAQFLFLVHLVSVIYAVRTLPLVNSDSWGSGGGCHGVPIAGRVLFYCDATGLPGTIATLDVVAVVLFGICATMCPLIGPLFWWVPEIGFQEFSWTVAIVLLIVTSFQWMLIGACLERLLRRLLEKTNKENPSTKDVKALSDLLSDNRRLELWRDVASAGYLAELVVIENARATTAVKECWKHRLQVLKKDLGSDGAPMLEQLLIQHAALCWLRLTLAELAYSHVVKGSITLTLGLYMEKRLTMTQRRFTRACETLTRVRKLSRNTPALQVNIASNGGQQVNLAK